MSHFLFKPHVVGPENNVTTPDVLIDRACVLTERGESPLPVHRLHAVTELQATHPETIITPAYGLIACGGGVLLGLAAILQPANSTASAADCVVARQSWRLRNVVDGFDDLALSITGGNRSESAPLPAAAALDAAAEDGNGERALPRGVAVFHAVDAATIGVNAPASVQAEIVDRTRERRLALTLDLTPVAVDAWEQRPPPRYTVGPVGDVKHYI